MRQTLETLRTLGIPGIGRDLLIVGICKAVLAQFGAVEWGMWSMNSPAVCNPNSDFISVGIDLRWIFSAEAPRRRCCLSTKIKSSLQTDWLVIENLVSCLLKLHEFQLFFFTKFVILFRKKNAIKISYCTLICVNLIFNKIKIFFKDGEQKKKK